MAIVCGNEQATKSFARTCSQSSRGLGACMKQPLTSPIVDLDNHTQGFNDIDDVAPSQAPTNDTPISSTSKAKEGKKRRKTYQGGGRNNSKYRASIGRDCKCIKSFMT